VRSKGKLQDQLAGASGCGALGFDGKVNTKRLIIMDEVDGMGGNEDRGGVAELIAVIKKSRVPFVCICNDRQHAKIRSLAGHCFDLRLRRPTKAAIAKRACDVAGINGLALEPNAAELLAESCGNDIRQVLNCLQMWQKVDGKGTQSVK
jgi:replication factor C subunit 1